MDRVTINTLTNAFDEIVRQHRDSDVEFWYARELQVVLNYATWDKFKGVIRKAITACEQSGQDEFDHFSRVEKMVPGSAEPQLRFLKRHLHGSLSPQMARAQAARRLAQPSWGSALPGALPTLALIAIDHFVGINKVVDTLWPTDLEPYVTPASPRQRTTHAPWQVSNDSTLERCICSDEKTKVNDCGLPDERSVESRQEGEG